jgi:tungstate transport system ATP-binding protein
MNQESKIIEAENIQVIRGQVEVLKVPSFCLAEKEIVSLIGPNGSGKSTLLLTLSGLLKSVSGRIFFRGKEIKSNQTLLDFRRRIAMVFQEPLLFDTTVFNNIASGLKIRGLSKRETRVKVMESLERFNIVPLSGRSARKLSGGEAQRTSLARALATGPEVIFLDEPFAALDPPTRQSIIDDMERVIRNTGIAAVLVTHDESEALRLSDRIIVMNGGGIVQTGSPAEVMNRPANSFVANFVGMETLIPGTVLTNHAGSVTVAIPGGEIEAGGEASTGQKVFCGIRPENVIIDTKSPPYSNNGINIFQAKIVNIISIGLFFKVVLEADFSLVSYVAGGALARLKISLGERVWASFKSEDVHLILGRQ